MEAAKAAGCGAVLSYCTFILLGAPFVTDICETIAMSVWTGVLLGLPLAYLLKEVDVDRWHRVLTSTAWETKVERACTTYAWCTLGTMWVSAIIIPLDWDVWYQKWPLPILAGSLLGAILGAVGAVTSFRYPGKWVKNA